MSSRVTFAFDAGGRPGPLGTDLFTPRFCHSDDLRFRSCGAAELRTQIGIVLKDTVLLRGTVRENIAFGRPDATEEEIIEAAKMANAHGFVSSMPDGYDSQIGDRGMPLSGGQRQRIGIARVLICNIPILNLDEPTAALNAEPELSVTDPLRRVMKGGNAITIPHRPSTLRDADRIVVATVAR
jgi:subfamily B ATP-binding cassette protein MsbA